MLTFGQLIRRNGRNWPLKPAYVEIDRRVTWGEFDRRSDRLGHGLRDLGVRSGDRVAILASDCIEVAEVFAACAKIGAIRVGLNARFAEREIAALITDCTPKAIFVQRAHIKLFQAAQVIVAQTTGRPWASSVIGFGPGGGGDDYETLIDNHAGAGPLAQTRFETIMIAYTTGSTGLPKGAVYPHQKFLNSIIYTALLEGTDFDARWLHAMPAAGIPIMHMLRNIFHASTTVIIGPWDAEKALMLMEREATTNTVLVPTMLNSLLESDRLTKHDTSSMRLMGYGASPLPPATIREAMAAFTCPFLQMYGTTELVGMSMMLTPGDHRLGIESRPEILASAGKALPFVDLRIVDEAGRDVAEGEAGELIVQSEVGFEAYWNAPEKTAETLIDGWLHTGDIATRDADGYIYLRDRAKFRIKTGGYNVFPTEIENVLAEHPAVNEVAVVGLADPRWGERIHAVVSLTQGQSVTADGLRDFCKGKIAAFKIPKTIDIWAEIPKGATGKIQKRAIIDAYGQ
jgi:acyl-CoA synthetase (AMP-forming)/AMP-acid ligase II